jgi:cytochrome c peroxidase
MTSAKVELGKRLFYDDRLSINGRGSCASCHQQRLAFTDGRAHAIGVTGENHPRASMSLVNVAYNETFTWASRELRTLEQQITRPLFNEHPIELGLNNRREFVVAQLESDSSYTTAFRLAFPETSDPVSIDHIIKALASFVRSIISADSAFDRLLYLDDRAAMSASAMRGMQLFFSAQLGCSTCHAGPNLVGGQRSTDADSTSAAFHNTGLYNVRNRGHYPEADTGLREESGLTQDDGRFRTPSLRNIAVTGPYMHDGSIATLGEVIDHYAAGGRTIRSGPNAGDGRANVNKSALLTSFELSMAERDDLLKFLASLTDFSLLDNPRFSELEK